MLDLALDTSLAALEAQNLLGMIISQNISNAYDPDYIAIRSEITHDSQLQPSVVLNLSQVQSGLKSRFYEEQSEHKYYETKYQHLKKIDESFGEPDQRNIIEAITYFFSTLKTAASLPNNLTYQNYALEMAKEMANNFNLILKKIEDIYADVEIELLQSLGKINQQLKQLYNINALPKKNSFDTMQQQVSLREIAKELRISMQVAPGDQVVLFCDGFKLLSNDHYLSLDLKGTKILLKNQVESLSPNFTKSKLAALIESAQEAEAVKHKVTQVRDSLIKGFDNIHTQGTRPSGYSSLQSTNALHPFDLLERPLVIAPLNFKGNPELEDGLVKPLILDSGKYRINEIVNEINHFFNRPTNNVVEVPGLVEDIKLVYLKKFKNKLHLDFEITSNQKFRFDLREAYLEYYDQDSRQIKKIKINDSTQKAYVDCNRQNLAGINFVIPEILDAEVFALKTRISCNDINRDLTYLIDRTDLSPHTRYSVIDDEITWASIKETPRKSNVKAFLVDSLGSPKNSFTRNDEVYLKIISTNPRLNLHVLEEGDQFWFNPLFRADGDKLNINGELRFNSGFLQEYDNFFYIAPGDSRCLLDLSQLIDQNPTLISDLADLIGDNANSANQCKTRSIAHNKIQKDLARQISNVEGVSIEEELGHLVKAQDSHEASGKVIKVVREMFKTLNDIT